MLTPASCATSSMVGLLGVSASRMESVPLLSVSTLRHLWLLFVSEFATLWHGRLQSWGAQYGGGGRPPAQEAFPSGTRRRWMTRAAHHAGAPARMHPVGRLGAASRCWSQGSGRRESNPHCELGKLVFYH